MSRDSLIGFPPFIDSRTANSRARSWSARAIRYRYFARSLPGQVAPARLERVARRGDREVDVLGTGLRHLGEDLLGRRVDRRHVLPALRLDELAADEQPVPVLETDDVLGLGRVRVLPRGRGVAVRSWVVSSSVIRRSSPRNGSPLPAHAESIRVALPARRSTSRRDVR